jgi:NAD(P)-dependent dehydrogenase (short-subunit alcohol dehydrogenase family)
VGRIDEAAALPGKVKERFGRLDILINNAATNPVFGPVMHADPAAWDKIMDVNLKGPFFLAKAAMEIMREQGGGKIVNVASVGGIKSMPGLGVYCISKAGVIMMTKVCAAEWGAFGINVNAVAPTVFKTKLSQALWSSEEILGKVLDTQPIRRLAESRDIVGAILFLASDASSFITGQTIVLDGGTSA